MGGEGGAGEGQGAVASLYKGPILVPSKRDLNMCVCRGERGLGLSLCVAYRGCGDKWTASQLHKHTYIAPLPSWTLASHPSVSQECSLGFWPGQISLSTSAIIHPSTPLPPPCARSGQTQRIPAREEEGRVAVGLIELVRE